MTVSESSNPWFRNSWFSRKAAAQLLSVPGGSKEEGVEAERIQRGNDTETRGLYEKGMERRREKDDADNAQREKVKTKVK